MNKYVIIWWLCDIVWERNERSLQILNIQTLQWRSGVNGKEENEDEFPLLWLIVITANSSCNTKSQMSLYKIGVKEMIDDAFSSMLSSSSCVHSGMDDKEIHWRDKHNIS